VRRETTSSRAIVAPTLVPSTEPLMHFPQQHHKQKPTAMRISHEL
jgi:hypothetical protein